MDVVLSGESFIVGHVHIHQATHVFPRGVWYGTVDGRACTAPCGSAERAEQDAERQLRGNGLAASAVDSMGCYLGWLNGNASTPAHLQKAVQELQSEAPLLRKLLRAGGMDDWLRAAAVKKLAEWDRHPANPDIGQVEVEVLLGADASESAHEAARRLGFWDAHARYPVPLGVVQGFCKEHGVKARITGGAVRIGCVDSDGAYTPAELVSAGEIRARREAGGGPRQADESGELPGVDIDQVRLAP